MKTQLLLFGLFISCFAFSQLPQANLQSHYKFTNGSLVDEQGNQDLTQTGTNITLVNDVAGVTNNAINLGGDYLKRTSTAFNDFSIAFAIKTSLNNGIKTTIIDQSPRVTDTEDSGRGWYIYLQNGKVGIAGNFSTRVSRDGSGPDHIQNSGYISTESSSVISDGNWHHIAITANEIITRGPQNRFWRFEVEYKVYIDGEFETTMRPAVVTNQGPANFWANNANLELSSANDISVATNNPATIVNTYIDNIDEIVIYNKVLGTNEIGLITDASGFCFDPDDNNLSIAAVNSTSIDVNVVGNSIFDITYHKSSEPFANAVTLFGVNAGITTISGLDTNTDYEIYYRKQCANNTVSIYSNPKTATTNFVVFISANASGNNDGTSWTDAYNDINNALSITATNKEVWVTAGTYKPSSTRTSSITVNANTQIYGGFSGNETQRNDRDFTQNITRFSGDQMDNDTPVLDYALSTTSDNNFHVVTVIGANVVLDGLIISNGNANGATTASREGSGLNILTTTKVRNCIIENNIATRGGAISITGGPNGQVVRIEKNTFKNNLAGFAAALYSPVGRAGTVELVNNLFYENETKPSPAGNGLSGVIWFRSSTTNSDDITLINNTFADNTYDIQNVNCNVRTNHTGSIRARFYNNIFWNNTNNSFRAFHAGAGSFSEIDVKNNLDENNFSNLPNNSIISVANTLTVSPDFIDAPNDNYRLNSTSSAVDFGDNSYLPFDVLDDLSGNVRIFNSTVDLGAFEFNSTLSNKDFDVQKENLRLYPNPTSNVLNIEVNNFQIENIEIYDVLGKQILSTTQTEINVSHLNNGIYLLKAKTTLGEVVKRFVKQ